LHDWKGGNTVEKGGTRPTKGDPKCDARSNKLPYGKTEAEQATVNLNAMSGGHTMNIERQQTDSRNSCILLEASKGIDEMMANGH